MISSLRIRNYALIDTLDIEFAEGFSVITGETGAGKSIILGALGLLLGQRADAKAIKTGETKCVVEASFDIEALALEPFFTENDIDYDARECLLRREVTTAGKSRAFINDTPVALGKLKELVSRLIDIHSQHQNLLLGQENFVLDTLDALAKNDKERETFQKNYLQYSEARRDLEALREQAEKDRSDTDYLHFQWKQLREAALDAEEQEALEAEQETLSHAEEIKSVLFQANAYLSQEEHTPAQELKSMSRQLGGIAKVYPRAEELAERLESVAIELADLNNELEDAIESIEFDPERMTFIDDRLDTIYSLEKKHGVDSVAELLEVQARLEEQLDQIENIDEHLAKKEQEVKALQKEMLTAARALTVLRRKAAETLGAELVKRLQTLGMPSVQIAVSLEEKKTADATGLDKVSFQFSANKNVPLREVAEIASGGEIARLMLSLKTIIAGSKHLPTIVFDEIDTGVSGTIAEKMALLMQEMGTTCQVLCITHLPQIAARGTRHYRVFKEESKAGTSTHIICLSQEERIREIANMLSGAELTEAAINNAKALLKL